MLTGGQDRRGAEHIVRGRGGGQAGLQAMTGGGQVGPQVETGVGQVGPQVETGAGAGAQQVDGAEIGAL